MAKKIKSEEEAKAEKEVDAVKLRLKLKLMDPNEVPDHLGLSVKPNKRDKGGPPRCVRIHKYERVNSSPVQ